MASNQEVLEVFRRYDPTSSGLISETTLTKVLQEIDPIRWDGSTCASLLEKSGLSKGVGNDKVIRYEELVTWVMGEDSTKPPLVAEADPACQAAYDGAVEILRGMVDAGKLDSLEQNGYVEVNSVIAGLWTMGVRGSNSFELRSLAADPTLPPASPLHYAVFAGQATAVQYLLEECGVSKSDEGQLGVSAVEVAQCHRVNIDGEVVDGRAVLEILKDEAPLSQDNLLRSMTRSKQRSHPA